MSQCSQCIFLADLSLTRQQRSNITNKSELTFSDPSD